MLALHTEHYLHICSDTYVQYSGAENLEAAKNPIWKQLRTSFVNMHCNVLALIFCYSCLPRFSISAEFYTGGEVFYLYFTSTVRAVLKFMAS